MLQNRPLYIIDLNEHGQKQISAVVIRFFEKGVLFKDVKNDEVNYLKWEGISKINHKVGDQIFRGILSNWYIPEAQKITQKKDVEKTPIK